MKYYGMGEQWLEHYVKIKGTCIFGGFTDDWFYDSSSMTDSTDWVISNKKKSILTDFTGEKIGKFPH